jgi:tetratricopeptide (TPR) repeat protein
MLAKLTIHQRRVPEARAHQERAIKILEDAVGSDSPIIAETLIMLAKGYIDEGHLDEAEPLIRQALAVRERALGAPHPLFAETLIMLAELHITQGQPGRALGLYQRLANIQERALGPNHITFADTLVRLAEIYLMENQPEKAESIADRGFAIRKKMLGTAHPIVAKTALLMSKIYTVQGTPERITELIPPPPAEEDKPLAARETRPRGAGGTSREDLQVLSGVEEASGDALSKRRDYIAMADSLTNRGQIYAALGQYAEAESLLRQALVIHDKILGADQQGLVGVLEHYAFVLNKLGKASEAKAIEERVESLRAR